MSDLKIRKRKMVELSETDVHHVIVRHVVQNVDNSIRDNVEGINVDEVVVDGARKFVISWPDRS